METGDGYRVIGSVIGANNREKNCRKIIKTAEIAVKKAGPWPLNIYSKIDLLSTYNNIADLLKESAISINDELLPGLLKNPAYNQNYS